MQKSSRILFAAAALLVIVPGVNAQYGDRDDRYRTYGREPLDRVRADLNRAERDLNYLSQDEMRRFRIVRDRIFEFQRNWERGRFDREALNETIRGLDSIIDRYRLRPRDRDLLADDVSRLRDMRERYDRGGGYRR
jgi:hypothetical protein